MHSLSKILYRPKMPWGWACLAQGTMSISIRGSCQRLFLRLWMLSLSCAVRCISVFYFFLFGIVVCFWGRGGGVWEGGGNRDQESKYNCLHKLRHAFARDNRLKKTRGPYSTAVIRSAGLQDLPTKKVCRQSIGRPRPPGLGGFGSMMAQFAARPMETATLTPHSTHYHQPPIMAWGFFTKIQIHRSPVFIFFGAFYALRPSPPVCFEPPPPRRASLSAFLWTVDSALQFNPIVSPQNSTLLRGYCHAWAHNARPEPTLFISFASSASSLFVLKGII